MAAILLPHRVNTQLIEPHRQGNAFESGPSNHGDRAVVKVENECVGTRAFVDPRFAFQRRIEDRRPHLGKSHVEVGSRAFPKASADCRKDAHGGVPKRNETNKVTYHLANGMPKKGVCGRGS
jgi:hypothetical protein